MANYKLTNKAVEDLSEIWNYTFEVWSEQQADKYYKELIAFCREIAKNQQLGKTYEGISKQLLGMRANSHIIFYRVIDNQCVEITRILHESMDLKNRIKE
jgi:toxin ParE1/3/4